jgi:hypothetical protein
MEPNRAPRVPSDLTALIFSAMLWARVLDAFGTSRLANPNTNTSGLLAARSRGFVPPVFHSPTLLWPPLPPAVGISLFAISRSPRPNSRAFSCEAPIRDPTCGSNGSPRSRSNGYSSSRFSRPRDLRYPMFGPLPCELPSSRDHRSRMMPTTLCPLA